MTSNKFILMGLLSGAVALGVGCTSDKSAERASPTEQNQPQTPSTPQNTNPNTPNPGTGGSGTRDRNTDPTNADVRDQDPTGEPGTGGSGYDIDDSQFEQDQMLSGDRFPSDDKVPQHP
jgi:hypothetical protein